MLLISKQKKTTAAHDIAEYRQFRALRAVSLGVGGLLAVAAVIVFYFMYLNIFDTISKVHSIFLLSNEYGSDIIDFPLYEGVKKEWSEKREVDMGTPLPRNIFSGSVASPLIQAAPKPISSPPGAPVNRSL